MSYLIYPDAVPTSIRETVIKQQYLTDLGNGMQQSRPKYTRARKKFSLTYTNVSRTMYDEVRLFFEANQGSIFEWLNPLRYQKFNVRFNVEEISCDMRINSCDFSLELMEV